MSTTPVYIQYLPYIILYFFLNNVLLPHGLLYTALLSPLFIYWIYKQHGIVSMLKWSLVFIIPIPFQLFQGVDMPVYLKSTALVLTAYIFLFAAIRAVSFLNDAMEEVFKKVLAINSILLAIALLFLPFSSLRPVFWNSIPISPNIPPFPRLDMLAYEPSHYALLLSPVFIFFIIMAISGKLKHPFIYVIATLIPLTLSFSFGIIGAIMIAVIIVLIIFRRSFPAAQLNVWIYCFIIGIALFIAISWFWPSNPLWLRITNIFAGADTSTKGRLFNSFMFAGDLIARHNMPFGVGPGQVKLLAHDLIINHYQYTGEFAEVVRIPNSMAEMLATYGIYGFVLKLFFEIYFFVKTKVYTNIYALGLFIFIFLYQFTGSFVVNVAELGIWALVYNYRPEVFQLKKGKRISA